MSGIYIHIPFCKQACHYCDFHFSTSLKNKDAFLHALKKEITLQSQYLSPALSMTESKVEVHSIYFGGGTPSLLSIREISEIFSHLHKHFKINPSAEITLEANPDDLTRKKLLELKQTPINRLSIGTQSFFDADLKFMNRAHNSAEAIKSIQIARDIGFNNISIDLIYGTPTLTDDNWKKNLDITFSLGIQHVSCYNITVEPKTALAKFIQNGSSPQIDDQQGARQFEFLIEQMKENDFIQYEISNFSKEGFHSKHNSNYWLKENYLGLGPSAHSYNGDSRQWNISNNALYIRSLENEELNFEKEILTETQKYNEYILTSLRTIWGVDLDYINNNFAEHILNNCLKEASFHIDNESLISTNNKLYLSSKGKLFADKIAADLFSF